MIPHKRGSFLRWQTNVFDTMCYVGFQLKCGKDKKTLETGYLDDVHLLIQMLAFIVHSPVVLLSSVQLYNKRASLSGGLVVLYRYIVDIIYKTLPD